MRLALTLFSSGDCAADDDRLDRTPMMPRAEAGGAAGFVGGELALNRVRERGFPAPARWGGPPNPRPTPSSALANSALYFGRAQEAGQGAGCGPGGPPHRGKSPKR